MNKRHFLALLPTIVIAALLPPPLARAQDTNTEKKILDGKPKVAVNQILGGVSRCIVGY